MMNLNQNLHKTHVYICMLNHISILVHFIACDLGWHWRVKAMSVCVYCARYHKLCIDQKWIYIKLYSASSRFEHCSNHSLNFFVNLCFVIFLQNGCRRPFWMSKTNFWWHFWPFQIPSAPNDVGSTLIQRQTMTFDQCRDLAGFLVG